VIAPVLVFLVCFGVGIVVSGHWLPDLAPGPIGGVTFFVVCGLFAAALSLAGLHVYSTINEIHHSSGEGIASKAEILANGLRNVLLDSGMLVGLAGIVYLLAPGLDDEADVATAIDPSATAAR
jgi:hypothetical protein